MPSSNADKWCFKLALHLKVLAPSLCYIVRLKQKLSLNTLKLFYHTNKWSICSCKSYTHTFCISGCNCCALGFHSMSDIDELVLYFPFVEGSTLWLLYIVEGKGYEIIWNNQRSDFCSCDSDSVLDMLCYRTNCCS